MAVPKYLSPTTTSYSPAVSAFTQPNWADSLVSDITSPSAMVTTAQSPLTAARDNGLVSLSELDDAIQADLTNKLQNPGVPGVDEKTTGTDWFKDSDLLSSYAGLGTALLGLYNSTFGPAAQYAKAQTKALEQNTAIAKDQYADLQRQKEGFRNFEVDGPRTSAFV